MMNKLVLASLVAVALVLSACDTQSSVTSPAPTDVHPMHALVTDLQLTTDQISVVGDMFYLEQDLGEVLNASQLGMMESVINPMGTTDLRSTIDRRRALDMEAILWLQLAMRANPDMDPAIFARLRSAVAANYEQRLRVLASDLTPEAKLAALEKLHRELMALINKALGEKAVANTQALKERLEAERRDLREKLAAERITRQVMEMTKVLGLDRETAAALHRLLTTQQAELEALRLRAASNPEAYRQALQLMQKAHEEQLMKLLGRELYAKWVRYRTGLIGTRG